MRVLVTGGGGFIGSHVVDKLIGKGVTPRIFDLSASPYHSPLEVETFTGSITDPANLDLAMRDCDAVVHLAAVADVAHVHADPVLAEQVNTRGTLNVLEAARRAGVRRVVHTSTSEVYGTPTELPIRETHPLNAQSPYAASKVGADQLAIAMHRSFGIPVTVLRPFNTYGPRQSARAVLPTIIEQLLAGRTEIHLGRLDPRRDLTYVDDTVAGFVQAALADGIDGETIQLGTGRSHAIGELFEMACRLVGTNARAIEDPERLRPDDSEVLVLESDPSRAAELLGWRPATSLEEGLRRTVEWVRRRPREHDPERLRV
jgi:nucleoside-diphosphate-sugar epimerase